MAIPKAVRTAEAAVAAIAAVLDEVDPDRSRLAPEARVRVAQAAHRVAGRVAAFAAQLLAEADRSQAAERSTDTPLVSLLGAESLLSKREATAAVLQARKLAEYPEVAAAATAGEIGSGQARTIVRVLDGLAPQLESRQKDAAVQVMLGMAATRDAEQLSKAAPQILAVVAPQEANELIETRLQREAEAGSRNRSFRAWREAGSVRFDGSLPRLAGDQLLALLDSHSEAARRTAAERRDPLDPTLTPEQRRADALIGLIRTAAAAKPEPGRGAATVIVKLDYDRLHADAAGAGLIADDQPISAGELRRLCCDADLLPAVLNGAGQVLDVGRSARLVTPAIRTALLLRDGGCVFPGCDVPASRCDAHHIRPWWDDGPTSLANLVLQCHHHHGLVEPAKYGLRDQWRVRIAADGLPEFLPPSRHPAAGKALRHARLKGTSSADAKAAAVTTRGGDPPGDRPDEHGAGEDGPARGAPYEPRPPTDPVEPELEFDGPPGGAAAA